MSQRLDSVSRLRTKQNVNIITRKFAMKLSLSSSPHLKRVTALSCEILMSQNYLALCTGTVLLTDELAGVLTYSRQQLQFNIKPV